MSSMIHRRLLMALLVFAAFAAFPGSTFAKHSWGRFHWARTSNPFTLQLGDNVSNAWDSYLNTTSSEWSASSVLDTMVEAGAGGSSCTPTAGRVEVCNTAYGNTGWLGVASIWASGTHIVQGTAKMNDTYFNTSKYNTPAWRQLVMCQEVGHTFGLDHQDVNNYNENLGSCMDYTSDPEGNEHPNQHDYNQLVKIYTHLDRTSTISAKSLAAQMPPAMRDIEISGPGQWGKLIHSSHGGWKELYELDFGGGHKVFTFVIWAIDEVDDADKEHKHQ